MKKQRKQPQRPVVKRPLRTTPPESNIGSRWLKDQEVTWLVEEYVERFGYEFKYFNDMSLVFTPDSWNYFPTPTNFNLANPENNSFLIGLDATSIIRELWYNSFKVFVEQGQEPRMPDKFNIGYIVTPVASNNSKKVQGSHYVAIKFEFSGLQRQVLQSINEIAMPNGQTTNIPPKVIEGEINPAWIKFMEMLPFTELYQLNIYIMNSSSRAPLNPTYAKATEMAAGDFPHAISFVTNTAKQGDYSNKSFLDFFAKKGYQCGDHAAMNITFCCLFGRVVTQKHIPHKIRHRYVEWAQLAAIGTQSKNAAEHFHFSKLYGMPHYIENTLVPLLKIVPAHRTQDNQYTIEDLLGDIAAMRNNARQYFHHIVINFQKLLVSRLGTKAIGNGRRGRETELTAMIGALETIKLNLGKEVDSDDDYRDHDCASIIQRVSNSKEYNGMIRGELGDYLSKLLSLMTRCERVVTKIINQQASYQPTPRKPNPHSLFVEGNVSGSLDSDDEITTRDPSALFSDKTHVGGSAFNLHDGP